MTTRRKLFKYLAAGITMAYVPVGWCAPQYMSYEEIVSQTLEKYIPQMRDNIMRTNTSMLDLVLGR